MTVTTRTFLAPFEQGKRIGNRAGGGAAEIPGDGDGAEFEWARARGLRQDQGRPARSEDHRLRVPLVVGFRDRHDGEIAKPRIVDQQVRYFEGRAFFHEASRAECRLFRRRRRMRRAGPSALFRLFSASPAMMPGRLAIEPARKWPGTSTCTSQETARDARRALRRWKPHPPATETGVGSG